MLVPIGGWLAAALADAAIVFYVFVYTLGAEAPHQRQHHDRRRRRLLPGAGRGAAVTGTVGCSALVLVLVPAGPVHATCAVALGAWLLGTAARLRRARARGRRTGPMVLFHVTKNYFCLLFVSVVVAVLVGWTGAGHRRFPRRTSVARIPCSPFRSADRFA